ncbi:hypothetical protein F8M41_013214 [Gigaspora margarita]|uniref:Uncharacterized protein n=1 Tax=Gigaspora margarita TaxID=4874 RepID=A0A8H4ASR3_GIGMA|nr:hypothetical protein F8M41_013214 [Gigaspora margarita]
MIKGSAKALIEKVIYSENSQIKSKAEKYVQENYTEYFEKFILKDWNVYYVNNIYRPKLFEELEEDSDDIYMNQILNKIWSDGKASPKKIAYAIANKLKYGKHFSISSSENEANKKDRDKSDNNDSENNNTKQENKYKNNSNYSYKVNKKPRVMNLDLEEVQEAEKGLDKDVDKEKDMNDYEKNTDNNK